jgi:long-subunit acyl-CoA synthetase (AMP-forming)
MKRYYKFPEAMTKAIGEYGWLDTVDLDRINPVTGDLIWTGRAKATILLSNGENVEPQPLEDADGAKWKTIGGHLVLSPTELANLGYLSQSEAVKLYLLPNP